MLAIHQIVQKLCLFVQFCFLHVSLFFAEICCRTRNIISSPNTQLYETMVVEAPRLEFVTMEESIPNIDDTIIEDGILSVMVSSLSLREAVRTSVLSPRWRNIWSHIPNLRFDAANIFDAPTPYSISHNSLLTEKEKFELKEKKKDQFIQSVNTVLQNHQGAKVEEILVQYYLTKVNSHHLDALVRFAVTSNINKFALDLGKISFDEVEQEQEPESEQEPDHLDLEPYDFPCKLFGSTSSLKDLTLRCCNLKPSCKFDGLSHLRKLNLFDVDFIEEDINNLLSNCYTLESLTVSSAPRLVTLSIPHALNQLQYLCVKHCYKLCEINIKAINLSRLHYWGPPVDFILTQSSDLRYANVFYETGMGEPCLHFYLKKLSRSLPHLWSLRFHISEPSEVSRVVDLLQGSSSFVHLKRLDWTWNASTKMTLPILVTFLDATPFMEQLNLHFFLEEDVQRPRVIEPPPQSLRELRSMLPEHSRRRIRRIEIHNFCWDKWQIEIALYFFKNAINLKTMKLYNDFNSFKEIPQMEKENLIQEVPANVNLVIL